MKRLISLLLCLALLAPAHADGINPGGPGFFDGITMGASGLRGDVFVNFATAANGAPTTAATGQTIVRAGASTAIVQATVSNGALVAADSGQSSTAAYTAWRLPEEVKSFYADVSFSDANDSVGLIVAGDVGSIGNTSIHIIFTISSWAVQYYSSTVVTTVQSGTFTAVPAGQIRRIGWSLSGSNVSLTLPDGTTFGPISSAALTTRSNNCAIFEQFRNAVGAPGAKIYAVATNQYASPTAAGRTNLLVNSNNIGAGGWTTTMTGPVSGLPDAAGGTLGQQLMETVVNQNQYFFQLITKAAAPVRYTQRFKVKPIGRDWVYLYSADSAVVGTLIRYLNLTTGVYGTVGGAFTEETALIYPLANGWYQVQQDFISNSDTGLYTALGLATADNTGVYAGDVTKGQIVYDEWLYARPN